MSFIMLTSQILGPAQNTAGRCPTCHSRQWHVSREDKTFCYRCYSCGETRPYEGLPGGERKRSGGFNREAKLYLGLDKLPPFPPYEASEHEITVDDTRRLSPVGREW